MGKRLGELWTAERGSRMELIEEKIKAKVATGDDRIFVVSFTIFGDLV